MSRLGFVVALRCPEHKPQMSPGARLGADASGTMKASATLLPSCFTALQASFVFLPASQEPSWATACPARTLTDLGLAPDPLLLTARAEAGGGRPLPSVLTDVQTLPSVNPKGCAVLSF